LKRRGFTLIETLIGLAVAAFLITGTAELMLRSACLEKKADILTAAAGLARDRMTLLRAQPFDGPELEEGSHEEIVTDTATGRLFRVTWNVELQTESMKAVLLSASPGRSSERGVKVRLLIARPLGF